MEERTILKKCKISGFADEIDQSMECQLHLLRKLGISYMEFRSGDGRGVADYSEKQAEELKKELSENKIGVSAIGSPIGKIGILDDFEPHFASFQHVCALADILETKKIRMFSFYVPEQEKPEKYWDEVRRRMDLMVNYAGKKGLVLQHENEKGIYGDNASRCYELMKEFDGPSFACTFDFANFVQCKQDTMEAYELLKSYITYIHVKDAIWDSGMVVPAGMGDGNVAAIFQKLEADGFEGFLSLEPHLTDFVGLQGLEKGAKQRGRSDGAEAFCQAHQALQKLLTSIE